MSDDNTPEESGSEDDGNRLVRVAKVRSAVIHYISTATVPLSATDLWVALEPKMTAIGSKQSAFVKILEGMAKYAQIVRVNKGRSVLYVHPDKSHTQEAGPKEPDAPVAPVARTASSKGLIDLDNVTIAEARRIYLMLHRMFGHEKR